MSQVTAQRSSCTLSEPMDRQTTFLLALAMLIAAASVVGVSGWVLFVRGRTFAKAGLAPVPAPFEDAHHHEGREGS